MSQSIKDQIKQELAVVNAQQLIDNSTQLCFDKCLFAPYQNNNSTSNRCVDNCLANYLKAWNIVSNTYIERIKSSNN